MLNFLQKQDDSMLSFLKREVNSALTENGAVTYATTMNDCLDLFSTIGALRGARTDEIVRRFSRAYAENPDLAMKIAFFAQDVRGGLGERRVFRAILRHLAKNEPDSALRNLQYIADYGRFDDLLVLFGTSCQSAMIQFIADQLKADDAAAGCENISLLAKWMPSINASN